MINARTIRNPHISLSVFYIPDTCFNTVRVKNLSIFLAKKPHSVKKEIISTYSIHYYYIITIVMYCISVMFYTQNMLAALQIWWGKQQMYKIFKSILHYSINILNLYVLFCVFLPTSIRLIGVHALLKLKYACSLSL